MKIMLTNIYGYHAWANGELLKKLAETNPEANATELETALRLMNHYHVVSRIFRGHLTGTAHGFASDNTAETPSLADLGAGLREIDTWYENYLAEVPEGVLAEPIRFVFTDGDRGKMTPAEMVMHVTLHGGYHRGEVGRILWNLEITPPWDTYAVYLHRAQPARRNS